MFDVANKAVDRRVERPAENRRYSEKLCGAGSVKKANGGETGQGRVHTVDVDCFGSDFNVNLRQEVFEFCPRMNNAVHGHWQQSAQDWTEQCCLPLKLNTSVVGVPMCAEIKKPIVCDLETMI